MEINKGRTHTIRNKHGYASSKTEIPQNIRRHQIQPLKKCIQHFSRIIHMWVCGPNSMMRYRHLGRTSLVPWKIREKHLFKCWIFQLTMFDDKSYNTRQPMYVHIYIHIIHSIHTHIYIYICIEYNSISTSIYTYNHRIYIYSDIYGLIFLHQSEIQP